MGNELRTSLLHRLGYSRVFTEDVSSRCRWEGEVRTRYLIFLSVLLFFVICFKLGQFVMSLNAPKRIGALMEDIENDVLKTGLMENTAVFFGGGDAYRTDVFDDRIVYYYLYRDNFPLPFWIGAAVFECDTNDVPFSCALAEYYLLPWSP